MLTYNPHSRFGILFVLRGSVFPRACRYSLPSVSIAIGFKILAGFGIFDLEGSDLIKNGAVYSGFSFVLGFILVFRTGQAYNRFWAGATAIQRMRTLWYAACAMTVTFSEVAHGSSPEHHRFAHTMIRLFSLLHAMALTAVAHSRNEDYKIIDIGGLQRDGLVELYSVSEGNRTEMVLNWIQNLILRRLHDGFLDVPPPLATRVFQELGNGIVWFNDAQQVMKVPFPFPYAQMTTTLIFIYMMLTPLVMCLWTSEVWSGPLFTFISVTCMLSIDFIAAEIEVPFGDDVNDIHGHDLQDEFNSDLLVLLDPRSWVLPDISPTCVFDHRTLAEDNLKGNLRSLREFVDNVAGSTESKDRGQLESVVVSPQRVPEAKQAAGTKYTKEKPSTDAAPTVVVAADAPPWKDAFESMLIHFQQQEKKNEQNDAVHNEILQALNQINQRLEKLPTPGQVSSPTQLARSSPSQSSRLSIARPREMPPGCCGTSSGGISSAVQRSSSSVRQPLTD